MSVGASTWCIQMLTQYNPFCMLDMETQHQLLNAVQFQMMSSGNIDAGTIKLYGIKDS